MQQPQQPSFGRHRLQRQAGLLMVLVLVPGCRLCLLVRPPHPLVFSAPEAVPCMRYSSDYSSRVGMRLLRYQCPQRSMSAQLAESAAAVMRGSLEQQ